jgi:hypothetical protein
VTEKLKRCPMCDSDWIGVSMYKRCGTKHDLSEYVYRIWCRGCIQQNDGASFVHANSEQSAIEIWNKRV